MSEFWLWFFACIGALILATIAIILLCWIAVVIGESLSGNSAQASRKNETGSEEFVSRCNWARAAMDRYEWELAYKYYSRLITDVERILSSEDSKDFHLLAAICALSLGNFDLVVAHIGKSSLEGWMFLYRAIAHYSLNNFPECVLDCTEQIRNESTSAAALWLRGLARIKTGDRTMAKDDFKKAIALDKQHGNDYGDDDYGYYFKGLALAYLGNKTEAMSNLKTAYEVAMRRNNEPLQEKAFAVGKKLNPPKNQKAMSGNSEQRTVFSDDLGND